MLNWVQGVDWIYLPQAGCCEHGNEHLEIGTSFIYWDQQSRCPFLSVDGDRLQSPKRRVCFYKG
jgi:hypothetical protein